MKTTSTSLFVKATSVAAILVTLSATSSEAQNRQWANPQYLGKLDGLKALPYMEGLRKALELSVKMNELGQLPVESGTPLSPLDLTRLSGGADAGGGNLVDGELFDFFENQGSVEVDPKSFQSMPALKQAFERLFSHGALEAYLIRQNFNYKTWYFEPKPITNPKCINTSLVTQKNQIVACQTALEVRISARLFKSLNQAQRAALILHELLVTSAMFNSDFENSSRKSTYELAVRTINREIFRPSSDSRNRVVTMLQKINIFQYLSAIPDSDSDTPQMLVTGYVFDAREPRNSLSGFPHFTYKPLLRSLQDPAVMHNFREQSRFFVKTCHDSVADKIEDNAFGDILREAYLLGDQTPLPLSRPPYQTFAHNPRTGNFERYDLNPNHLMLFIRDVMNADILSMSTLPSKEKMHEICDSLRAERWDMEKFVW